MQLARFVRIMGLLLLLGLVGFGGGCGPGSSTPLSKEDSTKVQQSHKGAHQQLKEDAQQHKADMAKQGAGRKAARRGRGGP
jgi:hypothetical protein